MPLKDSVPSCAGWFSEPHLVENILAPNALSAPRSAGCFSGFDIRYIAKLLQFYDLLIDADVKRIKLYVLVACFGIKL